jgi:hypothetical protein
MTPLDFLMNKEAVFMDSFSKPTRFMLGGAMLGGTAGGIGAAINDKPMQSAILSNAALGAMVGNGLSVGGRMGLLNRALVGGGLASISDGLVTGGENSVFGYGMAAGAFLPGVLGRVKKALADYDIRRYNRS